MKDFIAFEKAGMDADTLILKVTGAATAICAGTWIQVPITVMQDFQEQIGNYLLEPDMESYWESDVPGLGTTPCITLRLLPRKQNGMIIAELFMELDEGSIFSRHSCCFYVATTQQALESFAQDIPLLTSMSEGERLVLNGD